MTAKSTGWRTVDMQRHEGALTLRVIRMGDGSWASYVFVQSDWHVASHTLPGDREDSAADAIDAIERFVAQLGPVEPVLALLGAFARPSDYAHGTRRRAA